MRREPEADGEPPRYNDRRARNTSTRSSSLDRSRPVSSSTRPMRYRTVLTCRCSASAVRDHDPTVVEERVERLAQPGVTALVVVEDRPDDPGRERPAELVRHHRQQRAVRRDLLARDQADLARPVLREEARMPGLVQRAGQRLGRRRRPDADDEAGPAEPGRQPVEPGPQQRHRVRPAVGPGEQRDGPPVAGHTDDGRPELRGQVLQHRARDLGQVRPARDRAPPRRRSRRRGRRRPGAAGPGSPAARPCPCPAG